MSPIMKGNLSSDMRTQFPNPIHIGALEIKAIKIGGFAIPTEAKNSKNSSSLGKARSTGKEKKKNQKMDLPKMELPSPKVS